MANNSIFEFADKFGYTSPFGDWLAEEKGERQERQQSKPKEKTVEANFIISDSMKIGYWEDIWKAIQQVSYFTKIKEYMKKDKDFDIYIVRSHHKYSKGSLLSSAGKYLSTTGLIPSADTHKVKNIIEFDNDQKGYNTNKDPKTIQKSDEYKVYKNSFLNKKEVANTFNNKKGVIVVKVYIIVTTEDFKEIISKELKISKENYIISVAETIIHELYAHACNKLNNINKDEFVEHGEYHGQKTEESPSLDTIEKYVGNKKKLPAYIILEELKKIVKPTK